jgi:hypothetical protein
MKSAIALPILVLFAAPAVAQTKPPKAKTPSYEEALACFQYYSVAAELASKLEKTEKPNADQAAGFELQALDAKKLQAVWSQHIRTVAGKRTDGQIDADLKKLGAPIVADANAALQGDQAAALRAQTRGKSCGAWMMG